MDNGSFFVRVHIVYFKPGKREQANEIIKGVLRRWMEGYRGYIMSWDLDNPNKAIYTTFWDSEESMVKAMEHMDEGTIDRLDELSLGSEVHLSKEVDHWLHLDTE